VTERAAFGATTRDLGIGSGEATGDDAGLDRSCRYQREDRRSEEAEREEHEESARHGKFVLRVV
jgi:hypothetical protein